MTTTKHQFRVVLAEPSGRTTTAFIDAADEAGARAFVGQAFPRSTLVLIRLEPVDPCAAYQRRMP